ncbi:hypothetical protein OTK49_02840 [Vibrio coralliirubri]|uniref:hypothetical protein n=1 Tax=Vibrio coralliirubri TaxID=1516159 RepID=UPI002284E4F7|nr:hypothetical protein [Vibrio coralliirubri]MCY9861455.1 hypothetical protein [Vibrio coralliirubri]
MMSKQDVQWASDVLKSIGLTEQSVKSNISPIAPPPNESDSRIGRILIKHEGTGKAIREFDKNKKYLTDYAYWFYLSSCWVSYSGYSDLRLWRQLFSSSRPNRRLCIMKPQEIVQLALLPDMLTIYRAKRDGEKDCIAYTLNPEIAANMALQRNVNCVHQYSAKKEDVLALFMRRGEEEVIILDKSRVHLLSVIPVVVTD